MISLLGLAIATAPVGAADAVSTMRACDNHPVLMVVAGPTRDRARMIAYAQAIAKSQLYQKLGGYYLNGPQALATFEGAPLAGYATLIVRFPCLANAEAFWHSKVYQETIVPMRKNPSAGDYIVTVYPEVPMRADLVGKVGDDSYRAPFDGRGIPQVKR